MRPEDRLLKVRGKDGSVTLMGKGSVNIAFMATTVKASVKPSCPELRFAPSVTLYPQDKPNGLIAIRASWERDYIDFILTVTGGEVPDIDLKDAWIPMYGRKGQNIRSEIEVNIDERFFSTTSHPSKDVHGNMDGNLLLLYLNEEVPAQAVIDAACDEKLEADALAEAAELRKKLKEEQKNSSKKMEEALATCFVSLANLRVVEESLRKIGHCADSAQFGMRGLALSDIKKGVNHTLDEEKGALILAIKTMESFTGVKVGIETK